MLAKLFRRLDDYSINLEKLKPDFMIHGDEWKTGNLSRIREKCIRTLEKYGGTLLEIHTTDISQIASK